MQFGSRIDLRAENIHNWKILSITKDSKNTARMSVTSRELPKYFTLANIVGRRFDSYIQELPGMCEKLVVHGILGMCRNICRCVSRYGRLHKCIICANEIFCEVKLMKFNTRFEF